MSGLPERWGVREEETRDAWPCDAWAAEASEAWYRGVDVAAPVGVTFRWLCQLRAAPYSYDWIDNGGRTSPRHLTPGLERLEVGQRVMRIFRLVGFEAAEHVTVATAPGAGQRLFGHVVVTYRVRRAPGGCRLVAKLRVGPGRGWLGAVVLRLLAWGDLVMMRRQLLTLRSLAERDAAGAAPTDRAGGPRSAPPPSSR